MQGAQTACRLIESLDEPGRRGSRASTPPPSPEQRRVLAETAVDLLLDGIRVRPKDQG